jgi:hypothetical protein
MVTETLRATGVYVGPEAELLPPSGFNARGYFEHRGFVALNDDVLAAVGGAWDRPPEIWLPWERRRLRPLKARAHALVAGMEMESRGVWGWKDPRTCLTLPLWLRVVPDLRVVAVVRRASAVAKSLEVRADATRERSVSLWADYNRRLLRAAPRRRTIVTSYDAYLDSPERELERLVRFLRIPADSEMIARAAAAAVPQHRHHLDGGVELSPEIARLERDLFALAAK